MKSQVVLPHILSLFLTAGGETSKTAEPQNRRNNSPPHAKRELPRQLMGDFPGGPVAKIHTTNAGGLGSIPGQRTRSHMLQVKDPAFQNKTAGATTKT